jgi:hypothetical protein
MYEMIKEARKECRSYFFKVACGLIISDLELDSRNNSKAYIEYQFDSRDKKIQKGLFDYIHEKHSHMVEDKTYRDKHDHGNEYVKEIIFPTITEKRLYELILAEKKLKMLGYDIEDLKEYKI